MKRKLDETETKLTEKGIINVKSDIEELKKQIEYNELSINFQRLQERYQETVRPFLKERKEKEDKKIMDALNEKLVQKEDTLSRMNKHLTEGVEEKEVKED